MYIYGKGQQPISRADRIVKKTNVALSNVLSRKASVWSVGGGGNPLMAVGGPVTRLSMKPFSPLFQESNLMLPKDIRTMNAFNRHYYETDYWVGNAIDLHTTYPLGGFQIISKDKEVESVMQKMSQRIDLPNLVLAVGQQYWIYGEAFPFLEWDSNEKMWGRATVFNPDLIEVKKTIFTNKPIISLIPDSELKRIATSTNPMDVAVRNSIPREILDYVLKGENIPLNYRNVSHVCRKTVFHDTRGTSIIQRVWKELMLRDAFREVLFVMAQNHITPIKIFKIGGKDKDYFPTEDDLVYWQNLIEEAQNDPNFSIITHDAVDVQYVGATGHVLDVSAYIKLFEDNILTGLMANKVLITGEGPCVISGTEVLTKNGFKRIDDCTCDDEIGSINPKTGELEYYKPKQKFEFLVIGPMYNFKNEYIDHCVTPNHRCWVRKSNKEYNIVLAEDVKGDYFFKSTLVWKGKKLQTFSIDKEVYDVNNYLKFIGLYLAAGTIEYDKILPSCVCITKSKSKNLKPNSIENILLDNFPLLSIKRYNMNDYGYYCIHNPKMALHLVNEYSVGSTHKNIPLWIKELSSEHLKCLLDGYCIGSGYNLNESNYKFSILSKWLVDDLQEIALKCGYATKLVEKNKKLGTTYELYIFIESKDNKYAEPKIKDSDIKIFNYYGKVYSFDLPPNHIYVTRRNGLVTITGNSYANASIAYEVQQQRYVFFRNIIEQWLINKVFLPVSIQHGFRDNHGRYKVPLIKWRRMDFMKDADWRRALIDLNGREAKVISDRTLVTEMGLDYDEEQELLIKEKIASITRKNKLKEMSAQLESGLGGGLGGLGGGLSGGLGGLGGGLGGGLEGLGGGLGGGVTGESPGATPGPEFTGAGAPPVSPTPETPGLGATTFATPAL